MARSPLGLLLVTLLSVKGQTSCNNVDSMLTVCNDFNKNCDELVQYRDDWVPKYEVCQQTCNLCNDACYKLGCEQDCDEQTQQCKCQEECIDGQCIGYKVDSEDPTRCVDINECLEGNGGYEKCKAEGKTCVNHEGGYKCMSSNCNEETQREFFGRSGECCDIDIAETCGVPKEYEHKLHYNPPVCPPPDDVLSGDPLWNNNRIATTNYRTLNKEEAKETRPWVGLIFLTFSGGPESFMEEEKASAKCGSAVISPTTILTAAHCFENRGHFTPAYGHPSSHADPRSGKQLYFRLNDQGSQWRKQSDRTKCGEHSYPCQASDSLKSIMIYFGLKKGQNVRQANEENTVSDSGSTDRALGVRKSDSYGRDYYYIPKYQGTKRVLNNPKKYVTHTEEYDYIIHPKYRKDNFGALANDIALIKLDGTGLKAPLDLSKPDKIRPICLPNGEEPRTAECNSDGSYTAGQKCFVAGWGAVSKGDSNHVQHQPSTLMEVPVNIGSYRDCVSYPAITDIPADMDGRDFDMEGFKKWWTNDGSTNAGRDITSFRPQKHMCAANRNDDGNITANVDTCQGDSGGALICQRCASCNYYVAGIVSYGKSCGIKGLFGRYTKVAAYEDWIIKMMDISKSQADTKYDTSNYEFDYNKKSIGIEENIYGIDYGCTNYTVSKLLGKFQWNVTMNEDGRREWDEEENKCDRELSMDDPDNDISVKIKGWRKYTAPSAQCKTCIWQFPKRRVFESNRPPPAQKPDMTSKCDNNFAKLGSTPQTLQTSARAPQTAQPQIQPTSPTTAQTTSQTTSQTTLQTTSQTTSRATSQTTSQTTTQPTTQTTTPSKQWSYPGSNKPYPNIPTTGKPSTTPVKIPVITNYRRYTGYEKPIVITSQTTSQTPSQTTSQTPSMQWSYPGSYKPYPNIPTTAKPSTIPVKIPVITNYRRYTGYEKPVIQNEPSNKPPYQPYKPYQPPSQPSYKPSGWSQPIQPSHKPSYQPSYKPYQPFHQPSYKQPYQPTYNPPYQPSYKPPYQPSYKPAYKPAHQPSYLPPYQPSYQPSYKPPYNPSYTPSHQPSYKPAYQPTNKNSYNPSNPAVWTETTYGNAPSMSDHFGTVSARPASSWSQSSYNYPSSMSQHLGKKKK